MNVSENLSRYNKFLKESLRYVNHSIELNNSDSNSYRLRANIRTKLNDFIGALNDANISIKLNNEENENFLQRGLIYLKLNKKEEAIQDFLDARKLGSTIAEAYLK